MTTIHIAAFGDFSLTFLGAPFPHELYAAILADADGSGFVAEHGNVISGFVVVLAFAVAYCASVGAMPSLLSRLITPGQVNLC